MPQTKYTKNDLLDKEVVGGNKIAEVYKDPEIIPFLSDIATDNPNDRMILHSWMVHFMIKNVPFVVVEKYRRKYVAKLQLWKHGRDVV